MEKRLFLAFFLSLLVLYGWAAISPKPKHQKISESIGNKEVTTKDLSDKQIIPADKGEAQIPLKTAEIIKTLESEYSKISITADSDIKSLDILDYNASLPISLISEIYNHNIKYMLFNSQDNGAEFRFEDDTLVATKKIKILDNERSIHIETTILNKTSKPIAAPLKEIVFDLDMSNLNVHSGIDNNLNEYLLKTKKDFVRKAGAHSFNEKENKLISEEVNWAGYRDRYYAFILKPEIVASSAQIKVLNEKVLRISLNVGGGDLLPSQTFENKQLIYIGPEQTKILKQYNYGFEEIKRFYRPWIFDAVSKLIYNLLHIIHNIIPNWGLSIVVIGIIIYALTYPLTLQGMLSMRKMQVIQPKMNALKEKYKNNPQKLNVEMVELYKEHKINPLGGCLPLLLQMPIFIGLYQVLWRSVEFRGAKFLWIKDLAEADRLIVFQGNIPFIGNEINVLPLLMAVIMFFQQKLTQKNMVVTDPIQISQQKMMTTIFPIMMAVLFYHFPSGLALYFTLFYSLSTLSQWKMSKQTN